MICNDYEKASDIVPYTWILESLKMYKISVQIINFITIDTENPEVVTDKVEIKPKRYLHWRFTLDTAVRYSNDNTLLST